MVPLIPTQRPWERIGADIFNHDGNDYLIVVDYFSNFFDVTKINSPSTAIVIKEFKRLFATHGICDTLVTDNGACFCFDQFREFFTAWRFEHKTSSPHH